MKILLLGADGQLGLALRSPLGCLGELTAAGKAACNLSDRDATARAVRAAEPDVIVNAAAENDVDGAERDDTKARRVNTEAVGQLGELSGELGAALVHYSTDYVFDGASRVPYRPEDSPDPVNAYARSKLDGERALADAPAIVFRTAWVYGFSRRCFLSAMLERARQKQTLSVADDQWGSPTLAVDLAAATALILARFGPEGCVERRGVYHLAGTGGASRWELVQAAIALHPGPLAVEEVKAVSSEAFPTPARRPAYTVLDGGKAAESFGVRMPPWREALARALRSCACMPSATWA